MNTRAWMVLAVAVVASGCDEASVRLSLSNETITAAPHQGLLADGTSMRLRITAVYLAEDVDPVTQDNVGNVAMVWHNPDDTSFFDLSRPTAEVNAELNSQDAAVALGSYQYARIELCKGQPTAPTMMWSGPGMTAEQAFTSGDCGRTSQRFDPPLDLAAGDSVEVALGYDLGAAIVSGAPSPGGFSIAGLDHYFRACVDVDASSRDCMDFPEFAPSATKITAAP